MPNIVTFADFAASHKPHVEKHLRTILKVQCLNAEAQGPEFKELVSQLAILIKRGGKRLRPLLYLLAYEGYGGHLRSAALEVAISQELLHAFLLIHDDVIDRDYYRWGGRNIIGVYFEKYSRSMGAREALHAAEARAILAGDMCLTLAHERLGSSGFAPAMIVDLQQRFAQTVQAVIAGELSDMSLSYAKKRPTEAATITMYKSKTASYSFGLPLAAAALSAGLDSEVPLLLSIADDLGIAYQLQDDLLGVFATQAVTGKPMASDIRENKCTVLLLKTLELATPTQRRTLQTLLGKDNLTGQNILTAQTIMAESGAQQYTNDLARDHLARASHSITDTLLGAVPKACLLDMIEQLDNRGQ